MSTITLISDWHNGDYYLGAIKGLIYTQCPDADVIDISHQIQEYNTAQAAFVLRACYLFYPKGTVHIVAVNCESTDKHPFVLVKNEGHYFIGADNGMFGLLFDNRPEMILELQEKYFPATYSSFPELTLFARVATRILKKENPATIGIPRDDIYRMYPFLPVCEEFSIIGKVIYIDSYKNVVVNITHELFERVQRGRRFDILIQSRKYKISRINRTYNETPMGDLLALFNSVGMLEIAINKGKVAELLSINRDSVIRVDFYD